MKLSDLKTGERGEEHIDNFALYKTHLHDALSEATMSGNFHYDTAFTCFKI